MATEELAQPARGDVDERRRDCPRCSMYLPLSAGLVDEVPDELWL